MDKLHVTGRVKEVNIETRTLTAYASTRDLDRDGEVILPEAWRQSVQQFASVPLLWAHDYRVPPIGKAQEFFIDERGLRFTAQFAATEFAEEIWSLYKDGFLNSFSVGFQPKRWEDGNEPGQPERTFLEAELLEVSAVPVPANPFSRVERAVPVITMKSLDTFTTKHAAPEAVADMPTEAESVDEPGEPDNAAVTAQGTDGEPAEHAADAEEQESQRQTPEAAAATVAADADDELTPEQEAALTDMLEEMLQSVIDYLRETTE